MHLAHKNYIAVSGCYLTCQFFWQICLDQYLRWIGTGFSSGPDPNTNHWSRGKVLLLLLLLLEGKVLLNSSHPKSWFSYACKPSPRQSLLEDLLFSYVVKTWILSQRCLNERAAHQKKKNQIKKRRNGKSQGFALSLPCNWPGLYL